MTNHVIDLTGDYETTIYDVARHLLSEGASPRHTIDTRRKGVVSMKGTLGWLSKWRVVFATSGLRLKPFAACTLGRQAAETANPASQ